MSEPHKDVEVIDLTGLLDSSSEDGLDEGLDDGNVSVEDSDGSEIEITLNEDTRSQLEAAISTISETRLRQLLKNLVETDIHVEVALTRELVTLRRGTQEVVPRWETCGNCDEEFDVNTTREEHECNFHPGEVQPIQQNFADWDEAAHGPIDTHTNRIDYPNNFKWSCCDKQMAAVGCVHSEHKLRVRKRKRLDD